MKKLAIFVEGQTEQIFIDNLLQQIVGERNLQIVSIKLMGGAQGSRRTFELVADSGLSIEQKFYVMIVNSQTDNRVKSDINDNYESLVANGYSAIVGIRDVKPEFARNDIPRLRSGLHYRLKTIPIKVIFILGVMEIESWFLSESTHFERIHASLTPDKIKKILGYDPRVDDMQMRDDPAGDLHAAYQLVGFAYSKLRNRVERTVQVLAYEQLYLGMGGRLFDLDELNRAIDSFFV